MSGLTPKQEVFAQSIVSGMNQSDAYRSAYRVRSGTKPETVNQAASRIMADSNVTARVAELRVPIAKKAQMTLESHLDDLKGLRNMAVKKEQYSAAISAEIARGKASGLYVDKSEVNATINAPTLAAFYGESDN